MYIVISNQFAWLLLFLEPWLPILLFLESWFLQFLEYWWFLFLESWFLLFLEPPSAPQNVREVGKTNNRIELRWLPPRYNGGRKDVYYRIECDKCDSSVQYSPGKDNISVTRFVLFYLDSLSTKCAHSS